MIQLVQLRFSDCIVNYRPKDVISFLILHALQS